MGYSKDFLVSEIKRFNVENGRPPIGKDFNAPNSGYPTRKTFSNVFGSFGEALVQAGFQYRGLQNLHRRKPLPEGVTEFNKENLRQYMFKYIGEFGNVPTVKEMENAVGYPTRHDYRKNFGSWNNALIEFGLETNVKEYADEELKEAFLSFIDKHGRIPKYQEFNNSEYPSFWCYQNRFGSWNKAIKHYGFEPFEHKSIDELKSDIIRLCEEIYLKENRKIISYSDIGNSDFCSAPVTYSHNIKKYLGLSLGDFVRSIGYDMTKSGVGMNFKFEDGELVKSKYEYEVSVYLREKSISYDRDVRYKLFIPDYNGNKDCDYVIKTNGFTWYIEVAGMMDESKSSLNNPINKNYKRNLNEKIEMLEDTNLNYLIIYPSDLKSKSLDEIFSFLHKDKLNIN